MAHPSNYRLEEVKALVEGYDVLSAQRSVSRKRMWLFVRLLDLDHALPQLHPDLLAIVKLHGLIGCDQAETGRLLGISQASVSRYYAMGLRKLTTALNGGNTESA